MTTPIEITILLTGLSFGVGMAFKAIKWGKELFTPELDSIERRKNGRKYLSAEEHSQLCALASKPITDSIARIEASIIESNRARTQEIQRIFDKIDEWQAHMARQGERISALEARKNDGK